MQGEVLDGRVLGDQVADSVLEPVMARLCRDHGLAMPALQVWVRVDGIWRRLDFAYLEEMIDVEVDGYEHHGGSYERWESDLDRDAALTAVGWRVLRVSKAGITRRPAAIAGRIRATLDIRHRETAA